MVCLVREAGHYLHGVYVPERMEELCCRRAVFKKVSISMADGGLV